MHSLDCTTFPAHWGLRLGQLYHQRVNLFNALHRLCTARHEYCMPLLCHSPCLNSQTSEQQQITNCTCVHDTGTPFALLDCSSSLDNNRQCRHTPDTLYKVRVRSSSALPSTRTSPNSSSLSKRKWPSIALVGMTRGMPYSYPALEASYPRLWPVLCTNPV